MADITARINDALSTFYNVDDIIYQALICDAAGTIPAAISKPTDIDIGAMASMLEYLRMLSQSLLVQLEMDKSSSEFLKYCLEEYFNILRLDGESNETWIERTKGIVFQPKVSRAAIIKLLRPYSKEEPTIVQSSKYSMFADYSFAGRYSAWTRELNGQMIHVFPSIAQTYEDIYFSIVITLYGTSTSDYVTVVDILSKSVAAGIFYTLQVQS